MSLTVVDLGSLGATSASYSEKPQTPEKAQVPDVLDRSEKTFIVSVLRAMAACLRTKITILQFLKHKNNYVLLLAGLMKQFQEDEEVV